MSAVMSHEHDFSKLMHKIRGLVRTGLTLNPVDSLRIPMSEPTFGEDEIVEAIESLIRQNVTMGSKVERFEEDFADYIGSKNAVMVNSGSTANLLMMAAVTNPDYQFPLKPGDEVIVPALTWGTTLWPVIQMGCIPVLVDCDKDLNMDVTEVSKAITPSTKAIFVAHILGCPANMDILRRIAIENDIVLLEDACESLGTEFRGKKVGTFGDMGSYSFFFSHHITTIEGGMIVTDCDRTADLLRCLRAHGWTRHLKDKSIEDEYDIDPRFLFCNVGYSVRPTEIQGAFGIHQLKKLDGFNEKRKEVARKLTEGLKDVVELVDDCEGHTWFGFPIILKDGRKKELCAHLEKNWIATRPIIAGNLAKHPALGKFPHKTGDLTNAQRIMDNGFYINSCSLTDQQIGRVVTCIRDFLCER